MHNPLVSLFDFAEAKRRRDEGIDKVTSYPNDDWVGNARAVALGIAQRDGFVTADAVRKILLDPPPHPNCWGGVFRSKRLKWNGQMKMSETTSRHCGLQRVWEYV